MPKGIPFILANEAAERFTFYGMKTILVVFMTQYVLDIHGANKGMSPDEAKAYYHLWVGAVYFTPLVGAILADAFWGKYNVIFWLSLVYCFGNIIMALVNSSFIHVLFGWMPIAVDPNRIALFVGLALIAIGSGGIKPCVSANVGDQFGESNKHLIERVFGWFYFSINFGSFFSTLLTPYLLKYYGPHIAFGVPGFFMALATLFFWMGRYKYVHIRPTGMAFVREAFSFASLKSMSKLFLLYFFVLFFWALWDQTGSSWVLQAEKMDRHFMGFTWLESQIQALNPIMILLFIPLSTYCIYPMLNKVFRLTPLRKIGIGLFLAAISFLFPYYAARLIEQGQTPTIAWQFMGYIVITMAEIFVSITCLEFSYTQAPNKMKSFVMSFYLLAISLGNFFTSFVNSFIQNPDGTSKLQGSDYFMFFTVIMLGASVLFVIVSQFYKETTYIQGEEEAV